MKPPTDSVIEFLYFSGQDSTKIYKNKKSFNFIILSALVVYIHWSFFFLLEWEEPINFHICAEYGGFILNKNSI